MAAERRLRVLATHVASPLFAGLARLLQRPSTAGGDEFTDMTVLPDVAVALLTGRAVVALESTIITHGMPYPANVETAERVERVIREGGAVPATIAIIKGRIHVGLSSAEIRWLAQQPRRNVDKVSRRDVARVVAAGGTGSTTVAATMMIAHRAGIAVFVTGGIGGVHRGGQDSMDVSADLSELARTPVAVVCAGAKSILDIPRTLEVLETGGVSVLAWRTAAFPAFFQPDSGCRAPARVDSADDVARIIAANHRLQLNSGVVVAVPIPADAAADAAVVEQATVQALREADEQGIRGAASTPFLLQRVNELTGGASLAANRVLIESNACIGAAVAVALSRSAAAQHQPSTTSSSPAAREPAVSSSLPSSLRARDERRPLVLGGTVLDVLASPADALIPATSNPGRVVERHGGVARNIAEAAGRLGVGPALLSVVGDDGPGALLRQHLAACGVDTQAVLSLPSHRTAVYNAVFNTRGDLVTAIADMDVFSQLTPELIARFDTLIAHASILVLDANTSPATMQAAVKSAAQHGVPVWYEPTSVPKAARICQAGVLGQCQVISPNRDELLAMACAVSPRLRAVAKAVPKRAGQSALQPFLSALHHAGVRWILAKLGPQGVLVSSQGGSLRHYDALAVPRIRNVTGAGDSMVGACVAAMHAAGATASLSDAVIRVGLRAAALALQTDVAVSPALVPSMLGQSDDDM